MWSILVWVHSKLTSACCLLECSWWPLRPQWPDQLCPCPPYPSPSTPNLSQDLRLTWAPQRSPPEPWDVPQSCCWRGGSVTSLKFLLVHLLDFYLSIDVSPLPSPAPAQPPPEGSRRGFFPLQTHLLLFSLFGFWISVLIIMEYLKSPILTS